jgi:hypothetical protein
MPNIAKINKVKMLQMMNEGKSDTEIANQFGCSIEAVKKSKARIRLSSNNLPDATNGELSDNSIDSMKQMAMVNSLILKELERCTRFIEREELEINKYYDLKAKLEQDVGNKELLEKLKELNPNWKGLLKWQDSIITVAGESRKHIELQLKIAETLHSIQMNMEFQNAVIQAIREADSKTADKVVTRIKEYRSIRGLTKAN